MKVLISNDFINFITGESSEEEEEEYQCGRNEVFSDCGSPCHEKCNDDKNRVCAAVCHKGCFCKPGFVRKKGKCVNNDICLSESSEEEEECDSNEVYKKCGWRSDEKCDSRSKSGNCKSGCFCKKGYARKDNGRCVDIRECRGSQPDRTCHKPNEVYKSSGLRCEEECKKQSCGRRESGCFCQEGYSRINGVCKLTSECKKRECGAHQSYRCFSHCQERCNSDSLICGGCSDGCYCKDSYTRESPLFDCIPRETCSSEVLPDVPIF